MIYMTHWWKVALSFFLCLSLTAQAESDLLDLLNNRSHDRDAILRQFEDYPASSPEKEPTDDSSAETLSSDEANESNGPIFYRQR